MLPLPLFVKVNLIKLIVKRNEIFLAHKTLQYLEQLQSKTSLVFQSYGYISLLV